jgi:hypothetical protein
MVERNEFELSVPLIQHENGQGGPMEASVSAFPNIPCFTDFLSFAGIAALQHTVNSAGRSTASWTL